jgi:hypothetical protein
MIADAQARGLPVTADVAMYQLILTDEALHGFSSLYHVQPPLRSAADRDGLRAGGQESGVISAISSHHQPHEADAKLAPFGETEPGISSVEISCLWRLTLVEDGLLDLPTLLARLSSGPAAALRLAGRASCRLAEPRIWSYSTRAVRPWPASAGTRKAAIARSSGIACPGRCATPWLTGESLSSARSLTQPFAAEQGCERSAHDQRSSVFPYSASTPGYSASRSHKGCR